MSEVDEISVLWQAKCRCPKCTKRQLVWVDEMSPTQELGDYGNDKLGFYTVPNLGIWELHRQDSDVSHLISEVYERELTTLLVSDFFVTDERSIYSKTSLNIRMPAKELNLR